MRKSTPIILVEDDPDDQELMRSIVLDLGIESEVKVFSLCEDAYEYLVTTKDTPFIIFSDVNLPRVNGVEFKERIDNNPELRKKSIPFVFLTTTTNQKDVNHVYGTLSVQGFFQKPIGYAEAKELVRMVLSYWYHCKHPNSFDKSVAM
jgi:CheY-like chemotaxis protein